jgi:crotonobetainyl-CoA:carnitine CoA-transferase CaiB-like acyl-CoA transferase
MPGVLEGVRVVDLTSGVAGPMATMVLSDHGADVIKVEPPGGDPMRAYEGYVVWNRGKRSVVLDLHSGDDREKLLELLATADVLIENFSPGTMARWNLDYEALKYQFPALIYCSLTAYGQDTASSDRPGYDILVQARTGQQFEQPGWRDGPIFLYMPMPNLAASYLVLEGVSTALYVREVTGSGQHVDTSLYQGVLAFTTQLWQEVEHQGPEWWSIAKSAQSNIYECADGLWVHSIGMAVPTLRSPGARDEDRNAYWNILGVDPPERTQDPAKAAEQEQISCDAIKKLKRQEFLEKCWAIEIPIAPVRQAHEALDDQELIDSGMVVDVLDPIHGPTRQVGTTFRLHKVPAEVRSGQPLVGEHTEEVLSGLKQEPPRVHHLRQPKRDLAHALDGIKVLDMGGFLAGPFGPMLLGDLGAKVYKLEPPQGDTMRFATMPFNGCQRGKVDVCADLKTPEGVEIARQLMKEVDIVHHNMRPGVAERLGVDYETARELNPRVVYCQTTMWGLNGPRSAWPGFDQLAQASCGCEYELGGEGNPPSWYRFGMCDQACAFQSVVAVLLALYWREKTGEGQFVDTSIVEGGLYLNSDAWIGPKGPSVRPRLDKNQTGLGPLYSLYETSDGWIAIACMTEDHWRALTRGIGQDQLADDARFSNRDARRQHADELRALLEQVFKSDTAKEWFAALDHLKVPIEIAEEKGPNIWASDKELIDKGFVAQYAHPRYGTMRQFGHLVHLSQTPGKIWGPPPLLGQHTRDVLSELGYSDSLIESLREKGVIICA